MTEAMPFLQKYDITFLRPLPIPRRAFIPNLFDKTTEYCIMDFKWKPTVRVEFCPPL